MVSKVSSSSDPLRSLANQGSSVMSKPMLSPSLSLQLLWWLSFRWRGCMYGAAAGMAKVVSALVQIRRCPCSRTSGAGFVHCYRRRRHCCCCCRRFRCPLGCVRLLPYAEHSAEKSSFPRRATALCCRSTVITLLRPGEQGTNSGPPIQVQSN